MPKKTPVLRPCDVQPERVKVLVLDGLDRADLVMGLRMLAQDAEADALSAVCSRQWKLAEQFKRRAVQRHLFASILEQAERVQG